MTLSPVTLPLDVDRPCFIIMEQLKRLSKNTVYVAENCILLSEKEGEKKGKRGKRREKEEKQMKKEGKNKGEFHARWRR